MSGYAIRVILCIHGVFRLFPVSTIRRIESFFLGTKDRPIGRRCRIIDYGKGTSGVGLVLGGQRLKFIVINPGPPFPLSRLGIVTLGCKLVHPRQQDTTGMLMFTGQIVFGYSGICPTHLIQFIHQCSSQIDDLMMPRCIGHIQIGCVGFATKCHTLHFH